MRQSILAILHLTNALEETRAQVLARAVGRVDGVGDVRFDPPDESFTVQFDADRTGVGQIVREVEDMGVDVAAVALRSAPQFPLRPSGPSLMGLRSGLSSEPRG